jgi:hypothetical protein
MRKHIRSNIKVLGACSKPVVGRGGSGSQEGGTVREQDKINEREDRRLKRRGGGRGSGERYGIGRW